MSDAGAVSDAPGRQHAFTLPTDFAPVSWEKFETLNTKSPRPAIGDGECSWFDGFMPIGPSNARVLWGVGAGKFTASGAFVEWIGFGNIGDTAYGVVLQSDGAVHMFNITTGARFQVMPANTIIAPSSVMGFSQWGSQYLIFAKDQTNGYWLWDGTNLFTAGGVGPETTLTNAGSNYSSNPIVSLQQTGSATGVAFTVDIDNGSVTRVNTTNPGAGFAVGDFVALNFRGGGSDDQAQAGAITPSSADGGVSAVIIANGGNKYTARAFLEFVGGGGSGAVASISIQNGVVTAVAIVNPGSGYSSPPTVGVNDPGIPGSSGSSIPGGSGFSGFCNIALGQITSIGVAYGGSGYVTPPTVKILGDGTNAAAIAIVTAGQVTGVTMSNFGSGYTKALAVFEGGNNAANADPKLMPFGISGTAVEVAFQRVWITNGGAVANFPPKNRTIFSDPNTPVGFSNGGGAFQSTDSFLRVGYHWLKQTNGFLYLGGDSSVNYVSGVQTSGSTGDTTFSNLNVDPQYGSSWPSSVQVFGRNIVFANTIGVFVSYGGAVTKASLPLDGFYNSGPIGDPTANFSSAVAEIFGIPVYMLLLPVIDQINGQLVNKLLMYDGKRWFTSQQDIFLNYIATQEINSVLTAWGTDGIHVFPLFQKPSVGFQKVIQSKLFSTPGYFTTKTALRLSGVARTYAADEPLSITIDNEGATGTGNASTGTLPVSVVTVVNASGAAVTVVNAGSAPVVIEGTGIVVFGPLVVGQTGRMIGMTVSTLASDLALLSLNVAEQQPFTVNL